MVTEDFLFVLFAFGIGCSTFFRIIAVVGCFEGTLLVVGRT